MWDRLTNQVIVGKATPIVGRNDGHGNKGSRKEVLAAESRNGVSKHRGALPGAHETKAIGKEVYQESKRTEKERTGID